MKVVDPSRLAAEAADLLRPFRDEVVVIGAVAVEIAVAEAQPLLTPTRDVDVVVPVPRADDVIAALEAAEFDRSDVEYERGFTWERGDIKVQLVRPFHPFPSPAAKRLPQNPVFAMAQEPDHQLLVSFAENPREMRLRCAAPLGLLALKEAAFGRSRGGTDAIVERDFHDAYLLAAHCREQIVDGFMRGSYEVRQRALRALTRLAEDDTALEAAANQAVLLGESATIREAETAITRAARLTLRALPSPR